MNVLMSVVTQGLVLGLMVLGVYISYKLLNLADMSVDGSFALGGAVVAASLKGGLPPAAGMVLALSAGLAAGFVTGVLHVKFKISSLLSGILVMGALYSINLRIMGKANIPLFSTEHLFSGKLSPILIALILAALCKLLLDQFLKTGLGYAVKAVGDNPQMVSSLGIKVGSMKIFGLMLSNALIALSGSIMAQFQGFADASMGMGTLVLGIASIIIGQTLLKKARFLKETSVILVGTIIYQFTIYIVMNLGMTASDLKMLTSVIIILFLGAGQLKMKSNIAILGKRGLSHAEN